MSLLTLLNSLLIAINITDKTVGVLSIAEFPLLALIILRKNSTKFSVKVAHRNKRECPSWRGVHFMICPSYCIFIALNQDQFTIIISGFSYYIYHIEGANSYQCYQVKRALAIHVLTYCITG